MEKGEKPEIACYPLHPLRDVRKKKRNAGRNYKKEAGEEEKRITSVLR